MRGHFLSLTVRFLHFSVKIFTGSEIFDRPKVLDFSEPLRARFVFIKVLVLLNSECLTMDLIGYHAGKTSIFLFLPLKGK